jgi:putative nucleotidyltransferase with HDIG domain
MIPSRTEAAAVLLDLSPSPKLLRHATAVAEVAAFLAEHIERRGLPVDRRLVESAALLHDLDKALPRNDPHRVLGHGRAGARWLSEHGYEELAPAVADHPVVRLSDSDYPTWVSTASLEDRIVAYADKRAAQRLGHIDVRFARWYERHPEYLEGLRLARHRAALLENEVCAAAGLKPAEVGRLRWVRSALDRATPVSPSPSSAAAGRSVGAGRGTSSG